MNETETVNAFIAIQNLLDDYKRIKESPEAATVKSDVIRYGIKELIRRELAKLGIRSENIYAIDNYLFIKLEPGGAPDILKEVLQPGRG